MSNVKLMDEALMDKEVDRKMKVMDDFIVRFIGEDELSKLKKKYTYSDFKEAYLELDLNEEDLKKVEDNYNKKQILLNHLYLYDYCKKNNYNYDLITDMFKEDLDKYLIGNKLIFTLSYLNKLVDKGLIDKSDIYEYTKQLSHINLKLYLETVGLVITNLFNATSNTLDIEDFKNNMLLRQRLLKTLENEEPNIETAHVNLKSLKSLLFNDFYTLNELRLQTYLYGVEGIEKVTDLSKIDSDLLSNYDEHLLNILVSEGSLFLVTVEDETHFFIISDYTIEVVSAKHLVKSSDKTTALILRSLVLFLEEDLKEDHLEKAILKLSSYDTTKLTNELMECYESLIDKILFYKDYSFNGRKGFEDKLDFRIVAEGLSLQHINIRKIEDLFLPQTIQCLNLYMFKDLLKPNLKLDIMNKEDIVIVVTYNIFTEEYKLVNLSNSKKENKDRVENIISRLSLLLDC